MITSMIVRGAPENTPGSHLCIVSGDMADLVAALSDLEMVFECEPPEFPFNHRTDSWDIEYAARTAEGAARSAFHTSRDEAPRRALALIERIRADFTATPLPSEHERPPRVSGVDRHMTYAIIER